VQQFIGIQITYENLVRWIRDCLFKIFKAFYYLL